METGDFVRIDYIGKLESGEIFDLTKADVAIKEKIFNPKIKYKPVPIILGASFVLPSLEKKIMEMQVGEKKTIRLESKEAFGEREPKLVQIVNKNVFKEEPRPGMIIDVRGQKGRIQSVDGGRVRIDFNNPLAGKPVIYEIELVEKIEEPEKKIKAVFEFFGAFVDNVKIDGNEVEIRNANISTPLKQNCSELIKKYVKTIEKIRFIEEY